MLTRFSPKGFFRYGGFTNYDCILYHMQAHPIIDVQFSHQLSFRFTWHISRWKLIVRWSRCATDLTSWPHGAVDKCTGWTGPAVLTTGRRHRDIKTKDGRMRSLMRWFFTRLRQFFTSSRLRQVCCRTWTEDRISLFNIRIHACMINAKSTNFKVLFNDPNIVCTQSAVYT